jgi:hypothetical protein
LRSFSSRRAQSRIVVLCALVTLGFGCASSKVTGINRVAPDYVPRPDRVLVYDVAASAADVPEDSSLQPYATARVEKQTSEELELGRALGAQVAQELVERLKDLGLPATRTSGSSAFERVNDLVIRGGFVEVDEGNMALRVLIGFGAGASDLRTHFDVYQVTETGRMPLGSAGIEAAGGHMPGVLLSMGVGGVVKGLAVGGTLAAGREFTSESIEGAAERTAKEFIKEVKPGLEKRGWIASD